MTKSDKDNEIKALRAALEREQEKNAKLSAKHKADKAEIKNLKRRKDPEDKVKSKAGAADSKKNFKKELKDANLSEEQRKLAQDILRAVGILKK